MCDAEGSIKEVTKQTIDHPFDPAYYTWSVLFRSLLGMSTEHEVSKYIHNRSLINEEANCKRCEKWRDWLFQYSPTVTFLRSNIEKLGGNVDASNVSCLRCDTLSPRGRIRGAFSGNMGILLCANHIQDRKTMEDVLGHELVHAYDWMRFQFEPKNLKHVACTEIRAHMLSGECRWTREFFQRANFKFTMHFQDCVRRKAALAVKRHPVCKDDVQAVQTVNEVWESCFADTRPFDEIFR